MGQLKTCRCVAVVDVDFAKDSRIFVGPGRVVAGFDRPKGGENSGLLVNTEAASVIGGIVLS